MSKSGYVISNQYEEYLSSISFGSGIVSISWARSPILALVFCSRDHCHRVIEIVRDSKYTLWELEYRETKKRIAISCSCEVLPPWFDDIANR